MRHKKQNKTYLINDLQWNYLKYEEIHTIVYNFEKSC